MSSSFYSYTINDFNFTIIEDDGYITAITLDTKAKKGTFKKTELIAKTIDELQEYFLGIRKSFDIPVHLVGTDFQKKVWKEMMNIPYGTTLTYGELARRVGNPMASRAIGNVCNRNPILILIPCHRVVGRNSLGGFALGLDTKIKLLELEGVNFK